MKYFLHFAAFNLFQSICIKRAFFTWHCNRYKTFRFLAKDLFLFKMIAKALERSFTFLSWNLYLSSFISVFELSFGSIGVSRVLRKLHLLLDESFFLNNKTKIPNPTASTVTRRAYPFQPEMGPSLGGMIKARIFALYCSVKFISWFSSQTDFD